MPKSDDDPLGPLFQQRLRTELDRVQPRFSSPRYLSPNRVVAWRFAPAALAIGLAGIVGLTAYAATGSPNPAVWTERVVTEIHQAPPSPASESPQTPNEPKGAPTVAATHESSPEASERPEPSQEPEPSNSPEPSESPEPSQSPEPSGGDHGGSGSDGSGSGDSAPASPGPSPTPDH